MKEIMLKVDNVSKQYVLGQIGGTTLRDELQRHRAKRRGEEDPTRKIGAKSYNNGETFLALDAVSFEVKKGERVGIIGHNGAGKSTLLKLISRVTAPTDGWIGLNGRVASMLEVGTGFHGELTGRENIYMNGAILGMTKKEIDAKIEDIIDFSEVRQFIDTPVKRYSSGMYVKLAFSVAAHLDSEIMIMDEVLAVGDMAFQKKCLEKMSDVSKTEGRTILYVSHNMNTIRQLCNRVIVLDHGKIIFEGEVEDGIEKYTGATENISTCVVYTRNQHKYSPAEMLFEITELKATNSNNMTLEAGCLLELVLLCRLSQEFPDIFFRFEIKTKNGVNVGTVFTKKGLTLKAGISTVSILFDTTHLAPGSYYADIVAYQKNEFGRDSLKDGVYPGFSFVIDDSLNGENELIWKTQYWGSTHLHGLIASIQ